MTQYIGTLTIGDCEEDASLEDQEAFDIQYYGPFPDFEAAQSYIRNLAERQQDAHDNQGKNISIGWSVDKLHAP